MSDKIDAGVNEREGNGLLTDVEVPFANDPIAKLMGRYECPSLGSKDAHSMVL